MVSIFLEQIIKCVDFFSLCTERNLNPKAACLKRREEEKADDGSAKGMQGPPHLGSGGGAGGGGPPPMIPFGSMPSSVSLLL